MIGRTLVTRATRAGALDALEKADASAGRPEDEGGVLGVRAEDVRRVAGSYIGARDLTIVVVGDTTAMGGQIAELRRGVAELRSADTGSAGRRPTPTDTTALTEWPWYRPEPSQLKAATALRTEVRTRDCDTAGMAKSNDPEQTPSER